VALGWLLAQGDDVVLIPGTKSIGRLEEDAGAVEVALSAAEVDKLERIAPRQAWAGGRVAFAGGNWRSCVPLMVMTTDLRSHQHRAVSLRPLAGAPMLNNGSSGL